MDANQDILAIWHLIFSLMALGYGFEYYFHLSEFKTICVLWSILMTLRTPQEQCPLRIAILHGGQLVLYSVHT